MRYMHPLSFPFGINWVVRYRTKENCLHICLHTVALGDFIILTAWSGLLRVLVRHLFFCSTREAKKRKSPKNMPSSLWSRLPFREEVPVPQIPLQILFEVHQVTILAFYHQTWIIELSSKELLLLKSVMHHYGIECLFLLLPGMMCWRNSCLFNLVFLNLNKIL